MGRLYFRIYLAVIGSLLVFALLAGLAGVLLRALDDDDDRRPWPEMSAAIAERLLPADRDAAFLAKELTFWHERTGFSLMLTSPSGEVIATAGEIPQWVLKRMAPGDGKNAVWQRWGRAVSVGLPDGRRILVLRPRMEFHWIRHWRWLAALLGIGLAVGICAYPVVRQLTRKLERLQRGVAAFGGGDLSARVQIAGGDEVAKLAETFNASAARIERLLAAHKALLANASHELRSPLARLRMAIEGIDAGGASAAARAEIARNIEELDALVEEVLLASRLDAGGAQDLKREPVDLVGLVAEECAAFGAELSVEGPPLPLIGADARLLHRLFRNLLENALRYGGGEPITVTAGRSGADVQVTVCDRGPGVPEAERERIFEPFYRLKEVPESVGGTGLGLALVRQIAARHGGSVVCLPNPQGGACFRVRLPLNG
ncbi:MULTISPECIES: HAMP domain-containing sensor histidine kinase [Rhodomicrobium]|uniref:sensor histidine kinase n=1 Tax=Rhodomicrobium TaxID=1068 RepID=UPI000B4BD904|nr:MULTISPECIES: HAMP domain-containing sensor histidine kinase [Rhodomicrobium]